MKIKKKLGTGRGSGGRGGRVGSLGSGGGGQIRVDVNEALKFL